MALQMMLKAMGVNIDPDELVAKFEELRDQAKTFIEVNDARFSAIEKSITEVKDTQNRILEILLEMQGANHVQSDKEV
jgi:hypothetical protein